MRKNSMEKIYFVSSNVQKYEELKKLAQLDGIDIAFYEMSILELQTDDMVKLIKEKARKAFENLRRQNVGKIIYWYVLCLKGRVI